MSFPVIRLVVSIDTEEDNWRPARADITTRNIGELPGLERRFESLGVRATYFTSYQVVLAPTSAAIMREIHFGGRAEIGAHLHPWNTPPLLPDRMETMLHNVPAEYQSRKLATLTNQLARVLDGMPRSFRAGRFGLGRETVRALIEAGYEIDSSVTPLLSWEGYDGGPSFVGAPSAMYRMSGDRDVRVPDGGPLVEVPLSCGYSRWHPQAWPWLHARLNSRLAIRTRLRSVAARSGFARPVILSPEIHDVRDLDGLATELVESGLPYLHVFWHSPSMTPGLSPFCATAADVAQLTRRFETLLDRLERRVTLKPVTISEAVADLTPQPAPAPDRGHGPPVVVAVPATTETHDDAAPGHVGRHTAVYLAGILIGRAVSFLMLPFYTRYLTPADYGIMQLLEMTLDIIAIVAGTRIASGIHRYYYKARADDERGSVLSTAFVLMGVSFGVFGTITGLLAVPLTRLVLGDARHADLMRIASVTFGLMSLQIVPAAILQLRRRSVLITAITTSRLVIQLVLNIVFLGVVGLGVESVFVSSLVASVVTGVWQVVAVRSDIRHRVSGTAARSLLTYGLPLVGTQFAAFFITYGDRYFLRASADVTAVGLYSLAYQFGFIVASVGYLPFSMIWEPTRFQIALMPDRDRQYSQAFTFMNVILLVAAVGASLFVRDFIMVMSDPAYHSAYQIVPVILAAYVLQSWAYFLEVGILVRERTGYVTLANYAAALTALVGYTVLVPRWLGWGAAIATLLAFGVRHIVTYVIAQLLLPIRYDWAPVWRLVLLSTAFILAGVLLPHPGIGASLLMRAVLFAAYAVAVWHLNVITRSEKALLAQAVRSPRRALAALTGRP